MYQWLKCVRQLCSSMLSRIFRPSLSLLGRNMKMFSTASPGASPAVGQVNSMFEFEKEKLSPEEQVEKDQLVKKLTKMLSGPLADEEGRVPQGKDRPTAIEVDGPSHFYANSTRYTAYTKLKHRILSRMGYRVLHVPYFEWRKLRGAREREEYMRTKLQEEPTEWLDPEDEEYYKERLAELDNQAGASQTSASEATPVLEKNLPSSPLSPSSDSIEREVNKNSGKTSKVPPPPPP